MSQPPHALRTQVNVHFLFFLVPLNPFRLCLGAPVVSFSFVSSPKKWRWASLSPYGGERHSGTGIKAFREEEEGFADQEDFNVSLDFYKWEMKTHMSLSVKKFRRGFPNVRLDPFDIKLFWEEWIKEPQIHRSESHKNKRMVITAKIGQRFIALARRRRRREINDDGLIHSGRRNRNAGSSPGGCSASLSIRNGIKIGG